MTVDLPEPLPPTRPTVAPAAMVRLTPSSTRVSGLDGYEKRTSLNTIWPLTLSLVAPFLPSPFRGWSLSIISRIRAAAVAASTK